MKGHPIRVWIAENGLRSKDLCELANVSSPYLSKIINGRNWPNYDLAKRLSIITGIAVAELMTWNRK